MFKLIQISFLCQTATRRSFPFLLGIFKCVASTNILLQNNLKLKLAPGWKYQSSLVKV